MKPIRFILLFLILCLVTLLLHLWIYGTHFTKTNIANVTFVIGVMTFLPTMIAMSQSYKVFDGFNYAFRSLLSTTFRNTYPRFTDYKKERSIKIKTSIFLEAFIASSILIVISIVLTVIVLS
jgi:hypothetical protein